MFAESILRRRFPLKEDLRALSASTISLLENNWCSFTSHQPSIFKIHSRNYAHHKDRSAIAIKQLKSMTSTSLALNHSNLTALMVWYHFMQLKGASREQTTGLDFKSRKIRERARRPI
eukprot:scaffold32986_cov154-Skeletonema_menzelii.AAC.3